MLKKHLPTVILILIFCTGVGLLLYPTVSDYWNSLHQTRAINSYVEAVAGIDDESYEELLTAAREYNSELAQTGIRWKLSEADTERYDSMLRISGDGSGRSSNGGIMGYVEIPVIDCRLPIYHGTSDEVLRSGVGHLAGTSLPVGGESTHTVISGHRGLPSAKLFTNLDRLREGDLFELHILDEVLTYEVDRILIVEPDELSSIRIEEGQDYCTLVTCTPYGVNTHRLLVRGHRVEDREAVRVDADGVELDKLLVASVVAVPILTALLVFLLVRTHRRSARKGRKNGGSKARSDCPKKR